MAAKKQEQLQFQAWAAEELQFLKAHARANPFLKATEFAPIFRLKFPESHRTDAAIEHRVYKLRREKQVQPRRSLVAPQPEPHLPPNGQFMLTLPTGAVITGTQDQVLQVLSSLSIG